MKYAILINTCDKFEDCWDPFFKLMKKYWPDCQGRIYLNTEYKDYSYPGLDIVAVKGCERNGFPRDQRATWSQCLLWALELMEEDIVLYMQEDYFFNANVDNGEVEKWLNTIAGTPSIHCLHITPWAMYQGKGNAGRSRHEGLDLIARHYYYRVSCQAAFWKRDVLMSLVDARESAWDFEEFASERADYMPYNFYMVSKQSLEQHLIFPYLLTGIVQGRWYKPVVDLFKSEGIEMNYNIRGFYGEHPVKPFWKRVEFRLKKIPRWLRHKMHLRQLRSENAEALKLVEKPIAE